MLILLKFVLFYILGLSAAFVGFTLFMTNVPFMILYIIASLFFIVFPIVFKKNQKARDGLVWLSILASSVVLILGINIWIKRFNFEYGAGDVRMYLSWVHQSQLSYKMNSGNYANELSKLELQPFPGKVRYFFGLSSQCSANKTSLSAAIDTPEPVVQTFSTFSCVDNTMKDKFEVFAVGDLGSGKMDIWKIDQDKKLERVQDGRISLDSYSMFNFR